MLTINQAVCQLSIYKLITVTTLRYRYYYPLFTDEKTAVAAAKSLQSYPKKLRQKLNSFKIIELIRGRVWVQIKTV